MNDLSKIWRWLTWIFMLGKKAILALTSHHNKNHIKIDHISKMKCKTIKTWTGGVAQAVENLLCKPEGLSSKPQSPQKTKHSNIFRT
jgi:hypothetical protein